MKSRKIINAARKRFDQQLHSDEYKRVHADDDQLTGLLDLFRIQKGKSYLDIGTGNGYVAFSLARRFPAIEVIGLDIATASIRKNNKICLLQKLGNIHFLPYGGKHFPLESAAIHGAVSRYAFHHFPDPEKSVSEISRVLGPGGFFVFSDPLTYDQDRNNFIDRFQAELPDGHVHFYRRTEIEKLFSRQGFKVEKEFSSYVRYPRKMNQKYQKIFDGTDKAVLDKYRIEISGDEVYITVKVMNILFIKQ